MSPVMYRFDLFQNGLMVASTEAMGRDAALREIQHYALVYSQDGPVEIKEHQIGGLKIGE